MSIVKQDYGEVGGGNNEVHIKSATVAANATINVSITGKAKYVMYVEDRGYARLNYDPSTMEILSSGSMWSSTAFDDASFVNDSSFKFVCNDGSIQSTGIISSASNRYIWLIYTLE